MPGSTLLKVILTGHATFTVCNGVPEGRIGVYISQFGAIRYVHPSSPAELAGLRGGDKVILVDGRKWNIDNISGTPGTPVTLTVKRENATFVVTVKRVGEEEIKE